MTFIGATFAFLKWPVSAFVTRCGLTNSTRPSWAASYPSFSFVRRCTTTQGPACNTVQPTRLPSSAKICVMPNLIPIIPSTAIFPYSLSQHASMFRKGIGCVLQNQFSFLLRCVTECLDFHIHARRQIELHQSVNRIWRRLQNIDQAFVRVHLKLLARLFVHVRRAKHRPTLDRRRKRNRSGDIRPGTLGRFD